jgi:hypothetical protein
LFEEVNLRGSPTRSCTMQSSRPRGVGPNVPNSAQFASVSDSPSLSTTISPSLSIKYHKDANSDLARIVGFEVKPYRLSIHNHFKLELYGRDGRVSIMWIVYGTAKGCAVLEYSRAGSIYFSLNVRSKQCHQILMNIKTHLYWN